MRFETADGEPIVVNVDRENSMRRFGGGEDCSAINFETGKYGIVTG